ncbi:ABC transporter substrate-binding protein [Paenibacillus xerothermodurans]|uniref:ABC transporter substrate-binding protein n=1 Tax=Paenibacillus xerothermodurans TaxID=1977292 RepID=A0A2W1NT62_PAEXE|nr:ABC transporter substrate-binding protein [Paenibacillus xerothermodurans]PZE21863.1 ABC transporter substrate-binding protein [Paenibacillus xerothermodurans]
MFRRRWSVIVTGLLILCLIIPACSPSSMQETAKVRIGEVTRSVFYAPQYAAITKGYFQEQGLDVELTTTPGGDKTMTALLSGGIDIALVGSETSIYVQQQGSGDPVVNFAQMTQTDGTFLVSRNKVEGPFDWSSLKGTTFLGQRKGGMPQMAGEFALRKNGIDPHKDLNLIQNIDYANIATAFASGTGEYVQLYEPTATVFEQEGKGYVIASFGVESGKLPYTVFMAKKSFIDKNGVTIEKFTNALQKAQNWVQTASIEEIADSIASYFPDTKKEVIMGSVQRYRDQGSFATDGIVDEAEWNNLLDIMQGAGELQQRADYKTLVNNEFAQKAKESVK